MNGLLGPAIQGGIGVVSLVVMYLLLRAFITSLDRRLHEQNQAIGRVTEQLIRVASMVGVLIGRRDATPLETPIPPEYRKPSNSGG